MTGGDNCRSGSDAAADVIDSEDMKLIGRVITKTSHRDCRPLHRHLHVVLRTTVTSILYEI